MQLPFMKKNVNPKGKNTGDCVIRAMTTALEMDYYDVYEEMYELSKKSGHMVNDKHCEDLYLKQKGFVKFAQPKHCDGTKYRINEIRNLTQARVIVIRCTHHLTCVKDGVLIDTWNCGNKVINNYYIKGAE